MASASSTSGGGGSDGSESSEETDSGHAPDPDPNNPNPNPKSVKKRRGQFGAGLPDNSARTFQSTYKCFSVTMLGDREDVERGGKIIMPPSALDQLTRLNIQYPMLFKLTNKKTNRETHCGVLEFVADEGRIYIPYWMMRNLFVEEGDFVQIDNVSLAVATYAKFQPQSLDFLDITNPKAVLEKALRNFACLTLGDIITIKYNDKEYILCVVESKPGQAVSIIECDMKVDLAPPVGYEELERHSKQGEAMGSTNAAINDPESVQGSATRVETVRFRLPVIIPQLLSESEMENAIHKFLLASYKEEPDMAAVMMIHCLNQSSEKKQLCIQTLVKYLDNIIGNPTEEKYWKIRLNNAVFQEKVASVRGTEEFLQAAGFSIISLPFEEGEASFYVLDSELAKDVDHVERLRNMREVLLHAEPFHPVLDRDLKVFHPSSSASRFDIPEDFHNITPAELQKEQQKQEAAAELRRYKYVFIRIRFPDGVLLQGVFKSIEKMQQIYHFIRENLVNDFVSFQLTTRTGQKLQEVESHTLAELLLAPAALLNLSWDPDVLKEAATQQGHLKPEVMARIKNL